MKTPDTIALRIMLGQGTEKEKTAALAKIATALAAEPNCPECDAVGPHEDNGAVGAERTLCCSACGSCFDA